jgi:hypothetical protein
MNKATSRELRIQIRRILMSEWDPIGVSDNPDAADEYDAYIGGIYELLDGGASKAAIFAHLRGIEVDRMELIDAAGSPLLPEFKPDAAASVLNGLGKLFRPQ